MPILDRVSEKELREDFTHKGWFLACPVWVGLHGGAPLVTERNWVPEFWFIFNVWASQALDYIGMTLAPATYQPAFTFRITPLWEDDNEDHQ